MCVADNTSDVVDRLKNLSEIGTSQARRAVFLLFVAPVAQFAFGIIDLLNAAFNLFIVPLNSFVGGLGELINSIVGGAADIVGAGAATGATSIATGIWSALGPLAFPLAIGIVGISVLILARILAEQETTDSIFLLFSSTDFPDLPLIGSIGATEEDEEGGE
jgi:hypothetical protein